MTEEELNQDEEWKEMKNGKKCKMKEKVEESLEK